MKPFANVSADRAERHTLFTIPLALPRERHRWSGLLLLAIAVLGGCKPVEPLLPHPATAIDTVIQNRRIGETVRVQGQVTKLAPFLGGGAYQLQDSTGQIWAISNAKRELPKIGTEKSVTGIVRYQSIPVQNREFGEVYLEEK
jgi:hypothetical protein